MATKWLAFLLFFIQVEYLSCCVFDRVEKLSGGDTPLKILSANKNECLAACYAEKECFAAWLYTKISLCYLLTKGETPVECAPDVRDCYVLHRDEVDPVCKTFVNF